MQNTHADKTALRDAIALLLEDYSDDEIRDALDAEMSLQVQMFDLISQSLEDGRSDELKHAVLSGTFSPSSWPLEGQAQ